MIEYTPNFEYVQVMGATRVIKTIAKKGYLGCHIPSVLRWIKSARREYYCHVMLDMEGINSFFDTLVGMLILSTKQYNDF